MGEPWSEKKKPNPAELPAVKLLLLLPLTLTLAQARLGLWDQRSGTQDPIHPPQLPWDMWFHRDFTRSFAPTQAANMGAHHVTGHSIPTVTQPLPFLGGSEDLKLSSEHPRPGI